MRVLGLSHGFHDAAAALVVDGVVVAAVEEERLSRVKHDAHFPTRAMDSALEIGGIEAADIDLVVMHEKPMAVISRHMATRLRAGPLGLRGLLTTPSAIGTNLSAGHLLQWWFAARGATVPAVHYAEHHLSHAASAFYPSPFESAAVLTIDGVGEWATTSISEGHGRTLRVHSELHFPDSIGLLYSAFTGYCGFRVNSGEGELMGLAPYGEPTYVDAIRDKLVRVNDDGSFHLDQRYFGFVNGRRMTSGRFHKLFGAPPRPLGAAPTMREADLAASVQVVLEDMVFALAAQAREQTGREHLCLAGGVALNCVANGRLRTNGPADDVWVQPAASDAGSAIGAALLGWHEVLEEPRTASPVDQMGGAFLGPAYGREEIAAWLTEQGHAFEVVAEPAELNRRVAERLADGAVVGWFTGRMEFGPRALGHRSILADPRSATVQRRINQDIKERENFRPFAPAVLAEDADDWFDLSGDVPYMTFTAQLHPDRCTTPEPPADRTDLDAMVATVRSSIPAVTHVDHSARVQTVDADRNPEFHALLSAFAALTDCPVLLNTSFNGSGEPIVCTPMDAYATFRRTGLDLLVLEDCLVEATA